MVPKQVHRLSLRFLLHSSQHLAIWPTCFFSVSHWPMHPHLAFVRQILKRSLILSYGYSLGVRIGVAFQIGAPMIPLRGEGRRIAVGFPNTVLMRILTLLITLSLGARASVFWTFTVLLYFDIGRREI